MSWRHSQWSDLKNFFTILPHFCSAFQRCILQGCLTIFSKFHFSPAYRHTPAWGHADDPAKFFFRQNVRKWILGKVTRVGVHIIFRSLVQGYNIPPRVILTPPPVRVGLTLQYLKHPGKWACRFLDWWNFIIFEMNLQSPPPPIVYVQIFETPREMSL